MNRWSAVFFIWAIVAAAIGISGMGAVLSGAGRFGFVLFSLIFVVFFLTEMAKDRSARARIRS